MNLIKWKTKKKKVLNFVLTSDGTWRTKKECWKTFSKVLLRQNLEIQTKSELYTDDNKSKYSSNPKDVFKSATKFFETLYTQETTSKAATTKFLSKNPNRKKISNEQLNVCETKIYFDEIKKSINFRANNLNDALTREFYKYFPKDLAPVLLDLYNWLESLTPWMLLVEQESYLSYIKKVIKESTAKNIRYDNSWQPVSWY